MPAPDSTNNRLRLGILVEGRLVSAWCHAAIKSILCSDYATIELLIRTEPKAHYKVGSLYRKFRAYENRRSQPAPNANEQLDIDGLLPRIDTIELPAGTRHHVDGTEYPLQQIRDLELDVIVSFGSACVARELAGCARLGTWYFRHDTAISDPEHEELLGLHAVLWRKPYVTSALAICRGNQDCDEIGYVSRSGVYRMSHNRTRNQHLWKLQNFVPRALQRFHAQGEQVFLTSLEPESSVPELAPRDSSLSTGNFRLIVPFASYALWRLRQKFLRKSRVERWILMSRRGGTLDNLPEFNWLEPPDGKFWADPCIVSKDGCEYVYLEEASVETGIGHISVIELDEQARVRSITKIIEKPYHLSYPFVFEFGENWYLIPESADNKTVELYKCTDFPFSWEFERNLMQDVSAYDVTLFEHDDTWWIFVNIEDPDGASSWDELHLFYSDNPLGSNWQPHPMNPVVSDVRYARPAGKLFLEGGRIMRPSQNSSNRYGYALNIFEVTELSKTRYRETLVRICEPNWHKDVRAVHTLSQADNLTIIDAICSTPKPTRPGPARIH